MTNTEWVTSSQNPGSMSIETHWAQPWNSRWLLSNNEYSGKKLKTSVSWRYNRLLLVRILRDLGKSRTAGKSHKDRYYNKAHVIWPIYFLIHCLNFNFTMKIRSYDDLSKSSTRSWFVSLWFFICSNYFWLSENTN